ncbi:MAG: hypothetical protein AAF960_13290 [Bacteroidota bacterium]
MQQTQLVQLLKVLNEQELKALNTFLKRKPDKIKKVIEPLFDYLRKFAPAYNSPKLNRAVVLKKVFKKSSVTSPQLNKIAFQLKAMVEDFLVTYDLANDKLLKRRLLLEALQRRNHPAFPKESRSLIKELNQQVSAQSVEKDYLALFQLNHALWSNINTQKVDTDFEVLLNTNEYLDAFYWRNKLTLILEAKTSKSIIATPIDLSQITNLPFALESNKTIAHYPTIQLLVKTIRMVDSSQIVDYQVVKKALLTTVQQLTKKDAQDIFVTLTNFYNKHKGENPAFWKTEAFELYAFAHENNLLTDNGRMRYIEYCNAAIAGIITKNFAWSATFIEENKMLLSPKVRDLIYAYIKAFFHFQKQEFDQVIQLLKSIDLMDSFTYNLDINIQTLNLRVFFERWAANDFLPKEEQNWLLDQLRKFEHYIIGHKKLPIIKKENYLRFASFFRLLVTAIEANSPQIPQLKHIQKDLTITNAVELREWLKNTLARLIANLPHS